MENRRPYVLSLPQLNTSEVSQEPEVVILQPQDTDESPEPTDKPILENTSTAEPNTYEASQEPQALILQPQDTDESPELTDKPVVENTPTTQPNTSEVSLESQVLILQPQATDESPEPTDKPVVEKIPATQAAAADSSTTRTRIVLPLMTPPFGQQNQSTLASSAKTARLHGNHFGQPAPSEVSVRAAGGHAGHFRMPKKNSSRNLWITLLLCVVLLATLYFGCAIYFKYHFAFNTYINGVNCTFMKPEQVNERLRIQVLSYQIEVYGRGDIKDKIDGTSVGLVYVSDNQTKALLQGQNIYYWPLYLFQRPEPEYLRPRVELDELRFSDYINGLACMDPKLMAPPLDAYIVFEQPNHIIYPEVLGSTIDRFAAHRTIREAMLSTESTVDLDAADCYMLPRLFSDSPELLELIEVYKIYAPFSIEYTLGSTSVLLEASTIMNWVTPGVTTPGELDYNAVIAWVDALADRVDTLGRERTIINGYGVEKTVTGGTYGWRMDRRAEVEAILSACREQRHEVREPYFINRAASLDGPEWGGTYAEVDLTDQHMWYFENGVLIMDCDVVTGLPDGFNDTPEGVYYIWSKLSPTILIGSPDPVTGEPIYRSPVQYWMAITFGGVGFHDATWQWAFGGSHYLYYGSHGCVNMRYYDAQRLYSYIQMGCPVIMHF
ncbi:MAG: L,D-transpeptidase family protein [Coriobacteriia bacterium]|nr:L,D-transpeptidase family protein [Coriobacteriia bacterium]